MRGGFAMAAETEEQKKERKKLQVILVSIPGWPLSQPNRPMAFDFKSSVPRARRAAERLRSEFPDCEWSVEPLTFNQMRELQRKAKSKTLRDLLERRRAAAS